MPLTQEQVTKKYRRLCDLTKDTGLYTPPEAIALIHELGDVDESMLKEASSEYMKSIGKEGQFDYGILRVTGI